MCTSIKSRRLAGLGLAAVVLAGLALAAGTSAAGAQSAPHRGGERLVVRGDDIVKDGPCPGGVCQLELTDGAFRGTPVGKGAYNGTVQLKVAEAFSNGEGGVCAPIEGRIVLGAGSLDRLVLAVEGDSCQDGAGDLSATSFTGLARFVVSYGTGVYAKARGYGLATFLEDASDHERTTLIGRIFR
jgi:hypothetical protein